MYNVYLATICIVLDIYIYIAIRKKTINKTILSMRK